MKPEPKITHHNTFLVACKMFYLTLKYRGFVAIFSKECCSLSINVDYDTKNIRIGAPKGSFMYAENSKIDINYTEEK